jgi:hypothetical protein
MQRESIEVCSLFLDPFGVEAVWLADREIIERKNHTINSRRCDYLATNAANGRDKQRKGEAPIA